MEEVKNWWFTKKIEEFPLPELSERIQKVMDLNLSSKIVLIPYVGEKEKVEYRTNELIGLCPATGYPDMYDLSIKFIPREVIPELKSLKFYLMQYNSIPISHEHLLSKIYSDFRDKIKPEKLYMYMKVASRGGIVTTIEKGELI